MACCRQARLTLASGKRKCFYGKLRQDVQRQLVAALRDQQQGVPIVGGRQTVAQFLEHWLMDAVKPAVRPRTYEAYDLNVRRLVSLIGRERLVGLTPTKIQAAYGALLEAGSSRSNKGLSQRSVEQAHVVLHTALRYAVRSRVLAYNPADAVLAPRPDRQEMETLSVKQVQQLFDKTTDDRWHALWVLLGTTGLRLGEATGLKWEDLDLTIGQLMVRRSLQRQRGNGLVLVEPKTTRSRRTIHMTSAALDALRQHRVRHAEARLAAGPAWQEQGLVFCTYTGGPLDPARINEAFHRAPDRAGLPRRRVHDLRHSVASALLALGVPVHDVSAIPGHCQAAVTLNVYAHVTAQGQAEAIQKLDALLVAR